MRAHTFQEEAAAFLPRLRSQKKSPKEIAMESKTTRGSAPFVTCAPVCAALRGVVSVAFETREACTLHRKQPCSYAATSPFGLRARAVPFVPMAGQPPRKQGKLAITDA